MNVSKCQEIVEDRGAWSAAIHRVAKTRLSRRTASNNVLRVEIEYTGSIKERGNVEAVRAKACEPSQRDCRQLCCGRERPSEGSADSWRPKGSTNAIPL